MDILRELLSSDAAHHLGWMLLHSLWLMLIPAGGLALAMLTLPRRMSNTRYIVYCTVLLMLAGSLGVAALLVPDRVGALAEAEIKPVAESELATDPFAETPPLPPLAFEGAGNESPGPLDWMSMEGERSISPPPTGETALLPGMDTLADHAETNEAASGGSTGEASRQPQGWYARTVAAVEPYVTWAVPLWLLGVVALALWHLGGLIATHRLRSIGTRPAPYTARLQMQAIMGQMGVTRTVKLLESAVVHSPVVIGFLKPVVLVPVSVFAGLTPQQLEAILAHELAHIRRHDYLVNLVQTLIVTLLFYHPAVWWVSRQIRNERECCCDDIVVRLTPAPGRSATDRKLDYAKALTQVALLRNSEKPTRLAVAADHGSLLERIKRMMGMDDPAAISGVGPGPKAWLAGVLVLLIAVALPITIMAGDDGAQAGSDNVGGAEVVVDTDSQEADEKVEALAQEGAHPWLGRWFLVQEGEQQVPEGRYIVEFTENGVMLGWEDGRKDFETQYHLEASRVEIDLLPGDWSGTIHMTEGEGEPRTGDFQVIADEILMQRGDNQLVLRRAGKVAAGEEAGAEQPADLAGAVLGEWYMQYRENNYLSPQAWELWEFKDNGDWLVADGQYDEQGQRQLWQSDAEAMSYEIDDSGKLTLTVGIDEDGASEQIHGTATFEGQHLIVKLTIGDAMTEWILTREEWPQALLERRRTDPAKVERLRSTISGIGLAWVVLMRDRPDRQPLSLVDFGYEWQRLISPFHPNFEVPSDIDTWEQARIEQWVIDQAGIVYLPQFGDQVIEQPIVLFERPVEGRRSLLVYRVSTDGSVRVSGIVRSQLDELLKKQTGKGLDTWQIKADAEKQGDEDIVPAGPAGPAEAILGEWYGQFVDGSYLPSDVWCIWEFREDGKNSFTRGRYTTDGEIDPGQGEGMVTDYAIDEKGRLLLYLPGEDTKVCRLEIRNGTAYISVDQPNDFVFSREPRPEQFRRDREVKRVERASRQIESNARQLAAKWMDFGHDPQRDEPTTLADLLGDQPWASLSPLAPMSGLPRDYEQWDAQTLSDWLDRNAGFVYLPIGTDRVAAWLERDQDLPAGHILFFERPTPGRGSLWVVRVDERGDPESRPVSINAGQLDAILREQIGQGLDAWGFDDEVEPGQTDGYTHAVLPAASAIDHLGMPVILDLATGKMIALPDDLNSADVRERFLKSLIEQGLGDLVLSSPGQLTTFRNAQLGVKHAPQLLSFDIKDQTHPDIGMSHYSYALPEDGDTHLLIITAKGDRYEVVLLGGSQQADPAGLKIKYRRIARAEANQPVDAPRRIVIPDIDEPEGLEGCVLDLHNGELLNLPSRTNEQAVSKHFAELGQGDLAFEHASGGTFLITIRDATLRYGQDAERPENEAFGHGIAGYELLPSDEWVTVTTGEGVAYTLRIVENRGSDGLEIVYAPGTDVPELPAAEQALPPNELLPLDPPDRAGQPEDASPLDGRWIWCEGTIDNALAIAEIDGQGNLVLFAPDGGAEAYVVESSAIDGREIWKLTNVDPEGESVGLLTLRFVSEDRIILGIGEGRGRVLLYREDAYERIKEEALRLRGLQGAGEDDPVLAESSFVGRWVVSAAQVADWGVQSIEFEADGTVWEVRLSGERGTFTWRYDPEAGALSVADPDGSEPLVIWQATIEGDLLTLRREDRTVTLIRDDEPSATPQGQGEEGPGRPNEDAGASHPTFQIYVHADGLIRVMPGRSLVAVEELPGRIQAVDGFEDTAFLIFAHSDVSPEYLGQVAQAIREAGAATSAVLNLRVAQDPLAGEAAGQDGPAHRIVMTVAMAERGEVEVDGVGMLLHEMIGHIEAARWGKEDAIRLAVSRETPWDTVLQFAEALKEAGYENVQFALAMDEGEADGAGGDAVREPGRMLGLWYWSAGQADELTDLLGIEHRAGLLGLHIRGDGVITPIIGGEYDVTRDLVYDQLSIGTLIGIRPHDAPGIAGQVRAWDIDFDAETGDLLILNGPEDSSFTRYARKPPVEHAVSGKEALLGVWHAQMDNGDYVRADEPAESRPGFVFREGPSGTLEMVVSRGGNPDWTEAVAVKLLTDPPNFSIHPQGAPEPMTAHYAVFGEALLIFDPSRDSGGLTLLCRTPRGTDPVHARRLRSVEDGALTIEEGQERMESVQIDGPIPEDMFTIRHAPGEMFYDSDLSKMIQDEHALLLEVIPASFDKQGEQAEAVNVPGKHQPVYRTGDALLTLVDVAEASVMQGELGQPVLQLIVKPDAAERLAAYTRQHLGEPLLIVVEGEPVSAPVVQAVLGDRVQVTGFDEHTQAAFESIIEAVEAGQQEDDEAADAGQADADSVAGQYISVIDVEGKPIAGAAVRLFGSIDGQSIQLSDGVAGADGRFEIPGDGVVRADAKWLRVGVEAEGFVSRWTTHGLQISRRQGPGLPEGQWYITVRDGEAVNNVVLLKSSVVTGRAFDRDGNPLAGAPISVSTYCDYEDYWQGEGRGPTTGFFVANHLRGISDENGDYRIEGVPPGNVVVYYPWDGPNMSEVREGRWAMWTQPGEQYPSPPDTERCWVRVLDLEEGEVVENLNIDLYKSTAVIEAVVVDQNDRPIQGAAVTPAWSRQGGHHSLHGGELPTPVTDAQGRVRIEHLPPGEVEVFVRVRDGAGREASSMTLELTEGATRQVRFKVMDIEQPVDALEDDQQGAADDAGAGREADDEQGNHIAPEGEHRDALLA